MPIKTMANNVFKCTEKEGFYSVSEPISEHDIIAFAKQIIASKFECGTAITSPQASIDFLSGQIGHYEHEVFAALFLDSKHLSSRSFLPAQSIKLQYTLVKS